MSSLLGDILIKIKHTHIHPTFHHQYSGVSIILELGYYLNYRCNGNSSYLGSIQMKKKMPERNANRKNVQFRGKGKMEMLRQPFCSLHQEAFRISDKTTHSSLTVPANSSSTITTKKTHIPNYYHFP